MIRRTVLAAALAALAAAPAAQAADPFTAGTGTNPDVAVSPNGTGHVVWTDTASNVNVLRYCRVPKGASSCDVTKSLTYPTSGNAADVRGSDRQPMVFAVSDAKVVITGSCWSCGAGGSTNNRTFKFVSTNGGADFLAGSQIGLNTDAMRATPGDNVQNEWVDGLEGGTLLATGSSRFQAMNGPLVTASVQVQSCFLCVYRPTSARVPGTGRVVTAVSDLEVLKYANTVSAVPNPTVAQLNSDATWEVGKDAAPGEDADEPSLATGTSGLFLGYRQFIANDNQFRVRRFDPATNTFGPAVSVQGADAYDNGVDTPFLTQDPSGRLHGVYRSLSASESRLRYVTSTDGGATWASGFSLAKGESYLDPQLSVAADGYGLVAYQVVGGTGIRVLRLDPYADVTPPPVVTPPVVTPPKTTPPDPAVVGYAGPTYLGTLKPTTAKVDGATVSFGTPRTCVKPGQKFKVTLTWKKQRRKGNRFVKVRRSDFYIATKRVKVDRKAPFTQTLTVTASTKPGATVRLRARAFIKVSRGKSPTKSVFASIKVCG